MSDKEILAALEITSDEVRLLVGEFANTRLNVLKTERLDIKGIDGCTIKDPKEVTVAISNAVAHASEMLGVRIDRVLLGIPAYRMHKESQRVSKMIDHYERKVMLDDIQSMIKQGYSTPVEKDSVLVNLVCVRYVTNGISTRRIPVDEVCDVLDIDMDLLCADQLTAIDYVTACENAGLQVIDICLDVYALAKETALFEQSIEQNIVIIQSEKDTTTLSIISGGKLEASRLLEHGYGSWLNALKSKYEIDDVCAKKILLENLDFDNHFPQESPIFMWSKDKMVYAITEKDARDTLEAELEKFAFDIKDTCEPILQSGNVRFVLCGAGSEIAGLDSYLCQKLDCEVKSYHPDSFGAKNGVWTACLGMLYAYHDTAPLHRIHQSSVNQAEFIRAVKIKKQEEPDDRFTQRLKGLIFQDKK